MKNHYRLISPLLAPLFATALLSSCVVPAIDDGHYSSNVSGHVVYTSLPANYVGSAYFYNGRYYSGGNYQTGRYHDRGRTYTSRYYYKGQYYYGGNYQQHAPRTARREQGRTDQRGQISSPRSQDRLNGQIPASRSRY
jgi:hypothetical protein